MGRESKILIIIAFVVGSAAGATRSAEAGTWDLNLARLCTLQDASDVYRHCGGAYDASWGLKRVIPDNAAFRSLMSELGVIFAPNILSPAATRGFAGFNFSVEMGLTTVNSKNNANTNSAGNPGDSPTHWYWRAAESVDANAFADNNISNPAAISRIESGLPPSLAPTVSIMVRKGLWLPVPSFELGAGVTHLIGSSMFAGVATAKLALHEGFQDFPLPAFAVRGSASHVFGGQGFHMTSIGLDGSISKHFGIASTFNMTPYLGYQLLWIIADSEVLDATPDIDSFGSSMAGATNPYQLVQCSGQDCNSVFTFIDQADIVRHRIFAGVRINFYLVSLLVDYSYVMAGATSDVGSITGNPTKDESGAQHKISFALSLDY
jgi:hypothetical protein